MRYVFGLSTATFVHSFVHPFIWTDPVTMISHELLEQSQWNLQGIFTSPTNDLIKFWKSKVKVQQAVEVAKTFTSTLECRSPSSIKANGCCIECCVTDRDVNSCVDKLWISLMLRQWLLQTLQLHMLAGNCAKLQ